MTTNAPGEALTSHRFLESRGDSQTRTLLDSALRYLQVWLCGLHGHDAVLQYERTRMFLVCTSCGYETPGWEVSRSMAPVRIRPATRKPFVAPDLYVARKIA